MDGLQENRNYQIAIGEMQGCGYQICTLVRADAKGGVVATAWPGCPSLETEGGVTYALVGPRARTLLASEGHEMLIEGRIVEGTCTQQYAIEVASMELVPERGGGG